MDEDESWGTWESKGAEPEPKRHIANEEFSLSRVVLGSKNTVVRVVLLVKNVDAVSQVRYC